MSTCLLLDKNQLCHRICCSKRLDYNWMCRRVAWLVDDVAGLGSASWSTQTADGVCIYAEENLDTAVSETPSGTWRKKHKHSRTDCVMTSTTINSTQSK